MNLTQLKERGRVPGWTAAGHTGLWTTRGNHRNTQLYPHTCTYMYLCVLRSVLGDSYINVYIYLWQKDTASKTWRMQQHITSLMSCIHTFWLPKSANYVHGQKFDRRVMCLMACLCVLAPEIVYVQLMANVRCHAMSLVTTEEYMC